MESSFKFNIYFDERGEEIENIIAKYILQNIEKNIK